MSAAPLPEPEALVIETRFGPWRDLPVTTGHATYLSSCAITPAIAKGRVRSITTADQMPEEFTFWRDAVPGMLFTWTTPDTEDSPSRTVLQYKPDDGKSGPEDVRPTDSKGKQRKYWFQGDADGGVLWAVRQIRKAKRALIVEGTKPALVAASHAPADTEVYGIAGCWGLSVGNKIPTPDLEVFEGLDVVLCFDADATSNEDVHAAAIWSQKMLKRYKAKSVKFLTDIGDGKDGLDDVLRMVPEGRRGSFLEQAMEDAVAKLPAIRRSRGSAGGSGSSRGGNGGGGDNGDGGGDAANVSDAFFDQNGLRALDLANAVRDQYPAALTREHKVAVYQNGVYDIDGLALIGACTDMLEQRFREGHVSTVESFLTGRLSREGLWLPDYLNQPLVNVRNGMLDLVTGELHPHSPAFLSSQQLPIEWDPEAECPTYDEWTELCQVRGQLEDMEEVTSTMLDPSTTPPKALFLFGPSRSGKSTWLRLMQEIAGQNNVSAVTLHKLVTDRFAAANVYGKIVNIAADLSSSHIQDLSTFKMMTGEDPIQADRKYGKQFTFTNRALFAFSANELPTVGESSAAYIQRVKPFQFPLSFAGREDERYERTMVDRELSGILARWVQAYQRRKQRGQWLSTNAAVQEAFEAGSDRVRQWLTACCEITVTTPNGRLVSTGTIVPDKLTMTRREVIAAFSKWAEDEHGHDMTGKVVVQKLLATPGVHVVKRASNKAEAINVRLRPEGDRERLILGGPSQEVAIPEGETTTSGPAGGGSGESGGGSSAETTTTSAQVSASDGPEVAEVAVSEHFPLHGSNFTQGSPDAQPTGGFTPGTTTSATYEGESASDLQGRGGDSAEQNHHQDHHLPAETTTSPFRTVLEAGSTLPEGVVAIDIETAGINVWDQGAEFIRLVGYQCGDKITVTSDPAELIEVMRTARLVVGHNIMNFDLLAYARLYGLDLMAMAAEERVFDTFLVSILTDPPRVEGFDERIALGKIMKERSLDKLGAAILGVTKTGDLDGLAREFSPTGKKDDGYGAIPQDDPRYVEYLRGDVDLTARLSREMRMSAERRRYVNREHRAAATAVQMRLNGFRVDVPLVRERYEAGQARKAELIARLRDRYGLPTVKADGKPVTSPQATKEGKAAIVKAFEDLGVDLPTTEKGQPSTGKDSMEKVAKDHPSSPEVLELVETIQALNGVRSIYGTVIDHLHGDRVHPDIKIFQASGRWSTTDPGMTVFGKKDGKHTEREVFLPEPGHVIISADLAQIDARCLAALSQDEAYLAMFAPGLDLHTEVAKRVFGEPPAHLSEGERKAWLKDKRNNHAKRMGHGWNYNRSAASLSRDLVRDLGLPEDEALERAREFDQRMRSEFPRLVEWRNEIIRLARQGETVDNGWGRLLAINPDRANWQGPAQMGQSCATDHIKQALINIDDRYPHLNPFTRVMAHDELVFSIPEDKVEEYCPQIEDAMSYDWAPHWGGQTVPITAECSLPGANWGDIYNVCPTCGAESTSLRPCEHVR